MELEKDPHVLAIGEALIDVVYPAGHPEEAQKHPGGSPANVAMTLGRLGRAVALQTWFGNDEHGQMIEEHFSASHVHITPESRGAQQTTTAAAELDEHGAATYTFNFDWNPTTPIRVERGAQIVHAGSISAAQEPGATAVLEALRSARSQAIITYDPNARPTIMGSPEKALATVEEFVAVADVVKVSDEDIAWLTGSTDIDATIDRWLTLGPALVIVTRGKKGGVAVTRSGIRVSQEPKKVTVVDTVGAGDSFMGGIIDSMWELGLAGAEARPTLQNIDESMVVQILRHASDVSDVTVSRAGANPPWAEELK